jgi:acyl-[acyl-carrier protein] desaturase
VSVTLSSGDDAREAPTPPDRRSVSHPYSVVPTSAHEADRVALATPIRIGVMHAAAPTLPTALERQMWQLFRDFFDLAERKRRWRVADDIPWEQCNPALKPVIADVVETFCAVELFLPDYSAKILPVVRHSKGRTWFYTNWGYEESKHSIALGDWLLKSGQRTDEYMADLEEKVFAREWNLPQDNHLGMLVYAMVQEEATFVNYRNLRERCQALGGDPALEKALSLLAVDEKAHHSFFRDCLKIYLEYDREAVVEQLRRVMNDFQMPAIHDLLDESPRRIAAVRELELFDANMYYREVYLPIVQSLGISRQEMRSPMREKKSLRVS